MVSARAAASNRPAPSATLERYMLESPPPPLPSAAGGSAHAVMPCMSRWHCLHTRRPQWRQWWRRVINPKALSHDMHCSLKLSGIHDWGAQMAPSMSSSKESMATISSPPPPPLRSSLRPSGGSAARAAATTEGTTVLNSSSAISHRDSPVTSLYQYVREVVSSITSVQFAGGRYHGQFRSAPAATRGWAKNHAFSGLSTMAICSAVAPSARGSLASAKAKKSLRHALAVLGECFCACSRSKCKGRS
mmetsp:Transcript_58565/g.117617  ORF Transcript_58565/g.117617 Transcript_58565/m.117617 type:complete len:247 (+) Transcript_58565:125-865(+)